MMVANQALKPTTGSPVLPCSSAASTLLRVSVTCVCASSWRCSRGNRPARGTSLLSDPVLAGFLSSSPELIVEAGEGVFEGEGRAYGQAVEVEDLALVSHRNRYAYEHQV